MFGVEKVKRLGAGECIGERGSEKILRAYNKEKWKLLYVLCKNGDVATLKHILLMIRFMRQREGKRE